MPSSPRDLKTWTSEAGACTKCRANALIHCERGVWARPLFDRDATAGARVMIVAEAPNYDDTFNPAKGCLTVDPNTDPSGQFAHELFFKEAGLPRDEVIFTNAVLCLPAKSKDGKFPVKAQVRDICLGWLGKLISATNPEAVVTLGVVPLQALNRLSAHGLSLKSSAGKLTPWFGRILLPLYHPGRLGRVARKEAQQRQDVRAPRSLQRVPTSASTT